MATLTLTKVSNTIDKPGGYLGGEGHAIGTTPGSGSYTTNGDACALTPLGLRGTPSLVKVHSSSPLYFAKWSGDKLIVYNIADGSQVTGATDLSGVTFTVETYEPLIG